jgi:hypothetical protein
MQHSTVSVVALVLSVTYVALNSIFLYYLLTLDRQTCGCAFTWRRIYVAASLAVVLVLSVTNAIAASAGRQGSPLVSFATFVFILSYVVVTRQYITSIESSNCTCAEKPAFKMLKVINYIQIASILLVMLVGVALLLVIGTSKSSKSLPVSKPRSR